MKYFPVFKYNLEGFYIKSLACTPASMDYCVSQISISGVLMLRESSESCVLADGSS